ncbi:hypothetical protein LXA43DRAFT_1093845 [Ganoderma leucocontextum]|nr:hypothetical protein LXA43DRAFT_1093845 [Ganoderma leucocontextum]
MQNYGVTSLIGGATPGSHFSDVFYMNHDGKFVLNDAARSILNTTHPICQIAVSSGTIVDGLSVTYQLEGGNTALMQHGSAFNPPSAVVSFGTNEVLAAVYGREGYHSTYKRDMVTDIAFVVFDTTTDESRTVGPFGKGGQGNPFWVSDVLALGSFAQNTTQYGLSGLIFYKNPTLNSNSINQGLVPASAAAQAGNLTSLD